MKKKLLNFAFILLSLKSFLMAIPESSLDETSATSEENCCRGKQGPRGLPGSRGVPGPQGEQGDIAPSLNFGFVRSSSTETIQPLQLLTFTPNTLNVNGSVTFNNGSFTLSEAGSYLISYGICANQGATVVVAIGGAFPPYTAITVQPGQAMTNGEFLYVFDGSQEEIGVGLIVFGSEPITLATPPNSGEEGLSCYLNVMRIL